MRLEIQKSRNLCGPAYSVYFLFSQILVYIGTLTDKKWAWAKQIASGGPLGELVQWSDLIASLYLLGHDVTVPPTDDALTKK